MARIVFFITFLGLFLVGLSQNHVFAASSPYSVKGVEVDILDESSVKARNRAFIEAQRKAFEILSTRYYAAGELDVLKIPNDETLSGFIQDFKIASEQVSTKRYKGVFDFRFKATAVNQHFGRGPINYTGDITPEVKKILLLPYYHEEKKQIIFNKSQNPFWGSLLQDIANYKNVILPEGNIQDLTDIGDKNPGSLSPTTIRRLKARYDVGYVAVATASVNLQDQTRINIDVQDASSGRLVPVTNFDADPKEIAKGALSAAAGVSQPRPADNLMKTEAADDQGVIPQSEINPEYFVPNNQRGKLSPAARAQMIAKAQQLQAMGAGSTGEPKKNQNIPVQRGMETPEETEASADQGEANVQVFFNSMTEWVTLQKDLSRLDGIKGIRIVTLKTNQGDTVIEYNDWNKFLASLKANRFVLSPQSADSYVLKRVSDDF
jgi:TolB-like protein